MRIFVVYGSTGEYSDWREWVVAGYRDEEMAKAHVASAEKWYQENDCFALRYKKEFHNPFDPHMDTDYTGTRWHVGAVDVRDALPTVENPMPKPE